MITFIASALLAAGIAGGQQAPPLATVDQPTVYIAEMRILDDLDDTFQVGGAPFEDSLVFPPGENAKIGFSEFSLKSSYLLRTVASHPGQIGVGKLGKFEGYRILIVPDDDELLVSFRHLTWRQEKDSTEITDRIVLTAVAVIMAPGSTWLVRLDADSVIQITINEDTSNRK